MPLASLEHRHAQIWWPNSRSMHECDGIGVRQRWADAGDFHRARDISLSGVYPTGTTLASYPSEQASNLDPSTDFAATSDLGLAAYGLGSGQVRVMDLRDGKDLWTAMASKQFITALAFSPDGKTLATAAGYARVRHPSMGCRYRPGDRAPGRSQILGRLFGVLAGRQKIGLQQCGSNDSHLGRRRSQVSGRVARSSSGSVATGVAAR